MRFIRADQLFDGIKFLSPDQVLVLDDQNMLKEIVSSDKVERSKIEKYRGIITPGFVNAHCHLELSHLHTHIPHGTGLPDFGRNVISVRTKYEEDEIAEKMQEADHHMWDSGIVAVGDISNGPATFQYKTKSKIKYHTFIELIAFDPKNSEQILQKGKELLEELSALSLKGSLAPHAPYSCSLDLITKVANYDLENSLPFCMHNQESEEETKFFMGEKSGFHDLFNFLNLDISYFKPTMKSSLESCATALTAKPSLLIHNTSTTASDIAALSNKEIYWCFCPASNRYIENRLPDFSLFRDLHERICLGTDSLASNNSLDLVREANMIVSASETFALADILRAMTWNGACALKLDKEFGAFIPGKNTGLNQLTFNHSKIKFIKKIL